MENQTSQFSSLPVSPTPNENGINAFLPTPGFVFNTLLKQLLEERTEKIKIEIQLTQMKLENAKLKEELSNYTENVKMEFQNAELKEALKKKDEYIKEKEQSEAVKDSKISELTKMVQDLQAEKQLCVADENAKLLQSRMCTVADVLVDGKIDYKQLKYNILMVNNLKSICEEKWLADGIEISFEYPDLQICVTKNVSADDVSLSTISPRIFCSNIFCLEMCNATMTYSEYKKLTSSPNLKDCTILNSNIIDESSKQIEVDDILKEIPNVRYFSYWFEYGEITPDTAAKLSQLHFSKLEYFSLYNIDENFDFMAFAEFIKQHLSSQFELKFNCSSEFFDEIKDTVKELFPTLNSTHQLEIERYV